MNRNQQNGKKTKDGGINKANVDYLNDNAIDKTTALLTKLNGSKKEKKNPKINFK
jgi:hypothetical protein